MNSLRLTAVSTSLGRDSTQDLENEGKNDKKMSRTLLDRLEAQSSFQLLDKRTLIS